MDGHVFIRSMLNVGVTTIKPLPQPSRLILHPEHLLQFMMGAAIKSPIVTEQIGLICTSVCVYRLLIVK